MLKCIFTIYSVGWYFFFLVIRARIVVVPKNNVEHCRPPSPKITHHPSIFHHPHRYRHHLNIPMTVLLLHLSNLRHQSSITAENVHPTFRQRSTVWFSVLVECWASAKSNICTRNRSNVMKKLCNENVESVLECICFMFIDCIINSHCN